MRINAYHILIVLLLVSLFVREGCNCNTIRKLKKNCDRIITQIRVDTTYIKESQNIPIYIPGVTNTIVREVPRIIEVQRDGKFIYLPVDTSAILQDYYTKRFYHDSIAVQYGKVYVQDTITENRITSRKVNTDFNIPLVTKTITVEQPKRNQVYIGVNALGNQSDYLQAAGASLLFKNKRDRIIEGGAMWGINNKEIIYHAGIKFKLSLKKQ